MANRDDLLARLLRQLGEGPVGTSQDAMEQYLRRQMLGPVEALGRGTERLGKGAATFMFPVNELMDMIRNPTPKNVSKNLGLSALYFSKPYSLAGKGALKAARAVRRSPLAIASLVALLGKGLPMAVGRAQE